MKASPRILFCGMFKSPFILQDYELLKNHYNVTPVNLDIVWESREGVFIYLWSVLTNIIFKIYNTDICYIWFADIHAIPLLILSKIFNKRSILLIGGLEVANFPEINYGNQLTWRGSVAKWCIRNSNVIIVPSSTYKHITQNLIPDANIYVVPNAIDESLCEYPLPVKSDKVVTALFSLKDTGFLKGISAFKEAVEHLPYEYKIYDGVDHDYLMSELRKSRVYCQLSYTESFGVTNLEAMACGCVPVVTNVDILPYIIGDSGIVVPYGDVNATKDAIQKAMTMNGDKARERAKYFSRKKRFDGLSNIIEIKPLVSVVIPAYNAAKWLPDTIQSILNQTYTNIEVIVVDDCSNDNTHEVVSQYPSVIYLKNYENVGECKSSRRGFSEAMGKYICRLSADDMYANPDKIKHQVDIMEKTMADWSYNSINCVGETLEKSKITDSFWMVMPTRYGHKILQLFDNYILKFPYLVFLRLLSGNPVNSSTLMIRRSSYLKSVGWSSDGLRTDCDGLLLFNFFLQRYKCIAIREMGSFYRIHPEQATNVSTTYKNDMIKNKLDITNKVIDGDYPLWLKCAVKIWRR